MRYSTLSRGTTVKLLDAVAARLRTDQKGVFDAHAKTEGYSCESNATMAADARYEHYTDAGTIEECVEEWLLDFLISGKAKAKKRAACAS